MNKPKFPNSKQVSIAIVLVCVSLIAGALIAQALTPSSTFWISPGVYPGAPSYTVWTEGTSYFEKDSLGHTVYSGTNASDVLNHATYSAYTNGGGIVFVVVGTYYLTNTVLMWSNVKLLGEDGAVFTVADDQPDTWGLYHGLIEYRASAQGVGYNITVQNMILRTNPSGISYDMVPIIYTGVNQSRIEKCVIDGWNGSNLAGLCVEGSYIEVIDNLILHGGINIDQCAGIFVGDGPSDHIVIKGNIINGMTREGIYTNEVSSFVEVSHNIISNVKAEGVDFRSNFSSVNDNMITNATNSIYISNHDVTVSGNIIRNTTNGIYVDGSNRPVYNVAVSGNTVSSFYNVGIGAGDSYGVTISNNAVGEFSVNGAVSIRLLSAYNNTVSANTLRKTYDGIRLTTSTWNMIIGNIITETSFYDIIETASTSNYNMFIGNMAEDYIITAGANSRVNLCQNGTLWVT